jgi:hypothetical protein
MSSIVRAQESISIFRFDASSPRPVLWRAVAQSPGVHCVIVAMVFLVVANSERIEAPR